MTAPYFKAPRQTQVLKKKDFVSDLKFLRTPRLFNLSVLDNKLSYLIDLAFSIKFRLLKGTQFRGCSNMLLTHCLFYHIVKDISKKASQSRVTCTKVSQLTDEKLMYLGIMNASLLLSRPLFQPLGHPVAIHFTLTSSPAAPSVATSFT